MTGIDDRGDKLQNGEMVFSLYFRADMSNKQKGATNHVTLALGLHFAINKHPKKRDESMCLCCAAEVSCSNFKLNPNLDLVIGSEVDNGCQLAGSVEQVM
jgi:hypothetical protein